MLHLLLNVRPVILLAPHAMAQPPQTVYPVALDLVYLVLLPLHANPPLVLLDLTSPRDHAKPVTQNVSPVLVPPTQNANLATGSKSSTSRLRGASAQPPPSSQLKMTVSLAIDLV